MSYKVTDGKSVKVRYQFLDEDEELVIPKQGYPKVWIVDSDKDKIVSAEATPTADQFWEASLALPMIGVTQATSFRVRWIMRSRDGDKEVVYEDLVVYPAVEERTNDIVLMEGKTKARLVVPLRISEDDTEASIQIFQDNRPLYATPKLLSSISADVKRFFDKTQIAFDVPVQDPSFYANLVLVECTDPKIESFSYRMWVVTPQMIVASNMLKSFLDKAQIENVIPQLRYTQGDLISYLERGLYAFNTVGSTTSFTGTNMHGALLDAWVTCATYWALGSQLIAEGSLSFDFSGQSISFNVDRTPQLESALGRVESRIQDTVIPLKKQLVANGILGGDGAVGKTNLRDPRAISTLGLTNMPTTRLGGLGNYMGTYINRIR